MKRFLKALLTLALLAAGVLVLFVCGAALFNGSVGVDDRFDQSRLFIDPPAPWTAPQTLKVVTFNIQDLPFIGKDRPQRMRAIGTKLRVLNPDVVCFQEAFVRKDRELLLQELQGGRLKHVQYYPSGTVGSGLLIASVFPIKEAWFHRYSTSNPWYKVNEGDWWAGKGIALARLEIPGAGLLDIYNTHVQARYGNDAYDEIVLQQHREAADFITKSTLPTSPALVLGDFNSRLDAPPLKSLVDTAKLMRLMQGETRIDHIFGARTPHYAFEVSTTLPIEQELNINNRKFSLSDHTGYMSTIRIVPATQ
jgi:endonuclease/exonuclease/phosphatase family metal-dependent hydrolase